VWEEQSSLAAACLGMETLGLEEEQICRGPSSPSWTDLVLLQIILFNTGIHNPRLLCSRNGKEEHTKLFSTGNAHPVTPTWHMFL